MESLPKDIMIKFNPDTLEAVRKEFNLDKPGRINEAIDILDDWVKKQPHFKKKDFTREYLEQTLICCKGSVERAKVRTDKLFTLKTLLPRYFDHSNVWEEFSELSTYITHGHLPKMTPDHYRIYLSKMNDFDGEKIFSFYKYLVMIGEYMKKHEYSKGYILAMDFSDINLMSLITKINIVELRQGITILMEGYGMRLKGLHVISPSKAITALVALIKQVLSEKLSKRIHTHQTIDTVYEFIPKSVLPKEYGGEEERSLKMINEEWMKTCKSKDFQDYYREMSEAKTIESYRSAEKFAEQCIGMPGSFRSLSVD